MIVVADSGPIHYLRLLDMEHLLPQMFGRIVVPPVVAEVELRHDSTPSKVRVFAENPPDWLVIYRGRIPPLPVALPPYAGPGECAAIPLALHLEAQLLCDDHAARQEARRRHVEVTGTLGILVAAGRDGRVDFPAAATQLVEETNFHCSDALLRRLLQDYEDQRP